MPPQPNIEEVKREYFKYHYEHRENILPADITDWWIKKLEEAYTSGFNTAKERAVETIEKLRPSTTCDCTGAKYECEHWGRHEMIDQVLEAINNI